MFLLVNRPRGKEKPLFLRAKSMVHFILGREKNLWSHGYARVYNKDMFTMTMTCVQLVLIAGLQGHTITYVKCIV